MGVLRFTALTVVPALSNASATTSTPPIATGVGELLGKRGRTRREDNLTGCASYPIGDPLSDRIALLMIMLSARLGIRCIFTATTPPFSRPSAATAAPITRDFAGDTPSTAA